MIRKELNAHEIGVGQWRAHVSRSWLHRPRHKSAEGTVPAEQIIERIGMEVDPRTKGLWPQTKNGKYYVWEGSIKIPDLPFDYEPRAFITIPEGPANIPLPNHFDAKGSWYEEG